MEMVRDMEGATLADRLRKLAASRGYELTETRKRWLFTADGLEAALERTDTDTDLWRAEEILSERLDESFGFPSTSGYLGTSSGRPYVEYKLLPLQNNLSQKNCRSAFRDGYIIKTGSYVVGRPEKGSKEEFHGHVLKLERDIRNNITDVYVLAVEDGARHRLEPETVRLSSPYAKPKKMIRGIDRAMMAMIGSGYGS